MLTFSTGDGYNVTLISRPKRYEVHIRQSQESEQNVSISNCCVKVLQVVCDTLDLVISRIKHMNSTNTSNETIYELGFLCPPHLSNDSNDLLLNKPLDNASESKKLSPKSLWYSFLEKEPFSYFLIMKTKEIIPKMEMINNASCVWFGKSVCHPITITKQLPKKESKFYGDKVSFEIAAFSNSNTAGDDLEYKWFKDDQIVTADTHPYCKGAATSVLCIESLLPQYEGQYKCQMSLSKTKGVICSNAAQLTVTLHQIFDKALLSHHVSNYRLLPLAPPVLEMVDSVGKLVLGPDDDITINVPPEAVERSDEVRIQVQSFIPGSKDAIILPDGLKLFSPIYKISAFSKHFRKDVQLSLKHYASLMSSKDNSSLVYLHSTSKSPPYWFTELAGGVFHSNTSSGSILIKKFCYLAVAGPDCIQEKYIAYLIHPHPKLNPDCMCALFSVCYQHHAYLKHLQSRMEQKFQKATFIFPPFHHIELADDSKAFELVIPHEEIEKQGYVAYIESYKSTKILVRDIPKVEIDSDDYPFAFPLPCKILCIDVKDPCSPTEDLECELRVSGVKGDPPIFILRAEAPSAGRVQHRSQQAVGILALQHHFKVSQLLKDLGNEAIIELGQALGLSFPKLQRMKDMPNDMVAAWLRQEDDVILTSGDPTWTTLADKLDAIGQGGTARNIRREIGIVLPTGTNNLFLGPDLQGFSYAMDIDEFMEWLKSKRGVLENDCRHLLDNNINVQAFVELEEQDMIDCGISLGGRRILKKVLKDVKKANSQ